MKASEKSKIEFISYDGKYPRLCAGELKVMTPIGECSFYYEHEYLTKAEQRKNLQFPPFWMSGGHITNSNTAVKKRWSFSESALPACLRPYKDELFKVFDKNVERGCCGGCCA